MKILVTDSLAPEGLAVFHKAEGFEVDVKIGLEPEELKKICSIYDGWVIRSGTKITAELIDAATNLKVIGRAGVGYENIDADAATQRGIVVMNTPGGNNVTTGEHTIALMMSMARHIPQATASLKSGKWERNKFVGVELCNKTIGVIGLGNVGRIVAERAAGLMMRVIGFDPFIAAGKRRPHGRRARHIGRDLRQGRFHHRACAADARYARFNQQSRLRQDEDRRADY